jgi:hypothetical protein
MVICPLTVLKSTDLVCCANVNAYRNRKRYFIKIEFVANLSKVTKV